MRRPVAWRAMALIYRATLNPGKLDLIGAWLPSQPWSAGVDVGPIELVAAFRFDDPAGEVGIETHLLRTPDGALLQVPVTYRGTPYSAASLIGTTEHSVLGPRWVYDGCTDPVYVSVLMATILTGGRQADYLIDQGDGTTVPRPSTAVVTGSGTQGTAVPSLDVVDAANDAAATTIRAGEWQVRVARVLPATISAEFVLTGSWPGQDGTVLAGIKRH